MVAIKDMEMPSCCAECNLTGSFNWEHYCDVTLDFIDLDSDTKPDNCPLVEIEERKVGKWIKVSETELGIGYQCSECGRFILTESINRRKLEDFPYCHCGAEMRGSEND